MTASQHGIQRRRYDTRKAGTYTDNIPFTRTNDAHGSSPLIRSFVLLLLL